MYIKNSLKFQQEKMYFNLKDNCEDCDNYCDERKKCAMLYPCLPHQKQTYLNTKEDERIYFCKMFEAR